MLGRIFTVGGYTLLSRLTGFARDIMLAAILGAGPVADAFFVAFRLPNHFRAIFAEGAFNAAFVPAYAHVYGQRGEGPAEVFADRILFPECGPRRGLGRIDLRVLAVLFARLRPRSARRSASVRLAQARRGSPRLLSRTWPSNRGLDGDSGCVVRRYDYCHLSSGRS